MDPVAESAETNGDPEQPKLDSCGWIWPGPDGTKTKAVEGVFDTKLYLTPTTEVPDQALVECRAKNSKGGKGGKKRRV